MKDLFPGYFRPTKVEFDELWSKAIYVFDSSILLGFYRYSDNARQEALDALSALKDRLWLPNRVAREFLKGRIGVIGHLKASYDTVISNLTGIESEFRNTKQHPVISEPLLEKLVSIHREAKAELEAAKNNHIKELSDDRILHQIAGLFDGRVGADLSDDHIDELCKSGADRYRKKIPPGFRDEAKSTEGDISRPYGDFIIWTEIIELSKERKQPIIFVLDDQKEDWWLIHDKRIIAPRPELIREFWDRTGQKIYLYQPESFFRHLQEHTEQKVSGATLSEILETSRSIEKSAQQLPLDGHSFWGLHQQQDYLNKEWENASRERKALEVKISLIRKRINETEMVIAFYDQIGDKSETEKQKETLTNLRNQCEACTYEMKCFDQMMVDILMQQNRLLKRMDQEKENEEDV